MAAIKFAKILSDAQRAGVMKKSLASANRWFYGKTQRFRRSIRIPDQGLETNNDAKNAPRIRMEMVGNLYFFSYMPLNAKTLPYYDMFPLVMPFEARNDGIVGINFHYLPPIHRAILMDRILESFENENDDKRVLNRFRFSYEVLEALDSRYKYYRPAIKSYKFTQMRSRMLMLDEEEWKTAIFLPVHRFVGAKPTQVWNESRKKYNKG